jgi:uncharacterized protein (UPF0548 family)
MAVKEEEEGAAVVAMSIFLQGPGTGKWYQVVVDIWWWGMHHQTTITTTDQEDQTTMEVLQIYMVVVFEEGLVVVVTVGAVLNDIFLLLHGEDQMVVVNGTAKKTYDLPFGCKHLFP